MTLSRRKRDLSKVDSAGENTEQGKVLCFRSFSNSLLQLFLTLRDINRDGTVDPSGGAVRAAVQDFAAKKNRQIQIGYQ